MNIKGLTAELDMRDEAVDLQEEPKENEGNVATAVKETIDVPLEMDGESIRNSDVALPFKQRQRKKHLADPRTAKQNSCRESRKRKGRRLAFATRRSRK